MERGGTRPYRRNRRVDAAINLFERAAALHSDFDFRRGSADEIGRDDLNAMCQRCAAVGSRIQFDDAREPLQRSFVVFAQHAHAASLDPFEGMLLPTNRHAQFAKSPEAMAATLCVGRGGVIHGL